MAAASDEVGERVGGILPFLKKKKQKEAKRSKTTFASLGPRRASAASRDAKFQKFFASFFQKRSATFASSNEVRATMGREAPALCRWKDETGQVTALLESTEIILRGGIRARIPRATLTAIEAAGGTLGLQSGDGALTLDLGHDEAEKWAAILRKPPPTLAQKLGISEGALVFVIGALTDDALAAALDGATTPMIGRAAMLVAELHTQRDPTDALTVARGNEAAPLWAIHEKGPLAGLRDSDIRAALRAQAYVDTKSTAVSTAMTATLYRPKRG